MNIYAHYVCSSSSSYFAFGKDEQSLQNIRNFFQCGFQLCTNFILKNVLIERLSRSKKHKQKFLQHRIHEIRILLVSRFHKNIFFHNPNIIVISPSNARRDKMTFIECFVYRAAQVKMHWFFFVCLFILQVYESNHFSVSLPIIQYAIWLNAHYMKFSSENKQHKRK